MVNRQVVIIVKGQVATIVVIEYRKDSKFIMVMLVININFSIDIMISWIVITIRIIIIVATILMY
jgi:hypothetical protein